MPTRNIPLLRGTLAHIEADPKSHDQGAWGYRRSVEGETCGTTHCYAGWALVLGAPDASIDWYILVGSDEDPADWGASHVYLGDDEETIRHLPIPVAAAELLGLEGYEANRLFDGDNTLDDLRRIVGELCDGVPS